MFDMIIYNVICNIRQILYNLSLNKLIVKSNIELKSIIRYKIELKSIIQIEIKQIIESIIIFNVKFDFVYQSIFFIYRRSILYLYPIRIIIKKLINNQIQIILNFFNIKFDR